MLRALRRGAFLLLLALAGLACGPVRPAEIESADDLVSGLRRARGNVEVLGEAEGSILGVSGRALRFGDAEVVAYEYATLSGREAISGSIAPDGLSIGGVSVSWDGRPNIWAEGRLIVLYVGTDGGTIVLLSGLLGDPITGSAPPEDEPYPPGVTAAIGALARGLGIDPGSVDVLHYEAVDWPDACLGLPTPGEACAEVATPGWQVVLSAQGTEVEVHTDLVGAVARQVSPQVAP